MYSYTVTGNVRIEVTVESEVKLTNRQLERVIDHHCYAYTSESDITEADSTADDKLPKGTTAYMDSNEAEYDDMWSNGEDEDIIAVEE